MKKRQIRGGKGNLREGRPNSAVDTPVRKVREAETDMSRAAAADRGGTEPLRQALSAFLASSRAAQKALRRYSKARFDAWDKSLSDENRWLTKVLLDARDLETYEDGPAMGVILYVGGAPPGARVHHFHVHGLDGSERMLSVAEVCMRQVELLREALQAVEAGGPIA